MRRPAITQPHTYSACDFHEAKCHVYGKIGHIVQVCRSTQPVETVPWSSKLSATKKTNWLSSESPTYMDIDSQTEVIWQLRTDKANRPHPGCAPVRRLLTRRLPTTPPMNNSTCIFRQSALSWGGTDPLLLDRRPKLPKP